MVSPSSKMSVVTKRPLTAWNIYFQKHMKELSALERKKLTGRRSSSELMKVIAVMWQADKNNSRYIAHNPTFHMDTNMNLIAFC